MVLRKKYYENLKLEEKNPSEITNADMFQKVWDYVSKIPELKEAVRILYYAKPETNFREHVVNIADSCEVRAVVRTGGSEGVLIDYYLEGTNSEDPIVMWLGTFKTLGEDIDACIKMGMISGALIRAGELFLIYNLY